MSPSHSLLRPRQRKLNAVALTSALAVLVGSSLFAIQAWGVSGADVAACDSLTQPVSQRVNPTNKTSVLTTSDGEYQAAAATYSQGNGLQFSAASAPVAGLIQVRTLYKPYSKNTVYIKSSGEAQRAVSKYLYQDLGVAFYASATPLSCTIPVYRYRMGAVHRQVVNQVDRASLSKSGWLYEGISFYVAPAWAAAGPTTIASPAGPTSTTSPPSTTSQTTQPSQPPAPTTSTAPVTEVSTSASTSSSASTAAPSTVESTPLPSTATAPVATTTTPPVATTTTAPVATTTTAPVATTTTAPVTAEPPTTQPAPARPVDTKFSIAIMPDTQNEVFDFSWARFNNRTEWLAANAGAEALDIRFVGHTGDVVNWDTPDHEQYIYASQAMIPLEKAGIPYSLTNGNHDSQATGEGGSARDPSRTRQLVRDTTVFNQFFTADKYGAVSGVFEAGKVENNFSEFTAGGVEWLVLTLEIWPRPEVVTWAKSVVSSHPLDNVIVQTHSYLESNGSISQSNGGYGATSPQYLFDNLISQYPNIRIVFSGHVGEAASRTDVGVNGNKVYSLLAAIHSPTTNPVRIVEIDTAANTLTSKIVAPLDNSSAWRPFDLAFTNVQWVK